MLVIATYAYAAPDLSGSDRKNFAQHYHELQKLIQANYFTIAAKKESAHQLVSDAIDKNAALQGNQFSELMDNCKLSLVTIRKIMTLMKGNKEDYQSCHTLYKEAVKLSEDANKIKAGGSVETVRKCHSLIQQIANLIEKSELLQTSLEQPAKMIDSASSVAKPLTAEKLPEMYMKQKLTSRSDADATNVHENR